MEKGGTFGLMLVVIAILVITIGGGYWLFKADPEPIREATPLVETQENAGKGVRATRSFVILDGGAYAYTSSHVYWRSGTDESGEALYTEIPGADPESFEKIGTVAPRQQSSGSGGSGGPTSASQGSAQSTTQTGASQIGTAGSTSYSITFYSDNNNVYITVTSGGQTSSPQIVAGADPDSFQILNAEYSKDDTYVYVVIVTCVGGSCSAVVSIVPGADPDTFQAFPSPQNVLNTDCTAYVVADGQDANHVYNNGVVVDGVSVYLIGQSGDCSDTPVLISP